MSADYTATPVADLATARASLETIAASSITPTSVMESTTFTWSEMIDLFQAFYKRTNGGSEDQTFHIELISFYGELEAAMSAV